MSVAKLIGADGTSGVTVGATSKAAQATLFDPWGNEIILTPTGSFLAGFLWRDTGVGTDGMLMSIFNPSTSTVIARIRHWHLNIVFDGTGTAAGSNYYTKRTGFVAPTGGVGVTPTKKRSADAASACDFRYISSGSTALTQGSLTQTSEQFIRLNMGLNPTGRVTYFELTRQSALRRLNGAMELGPGEGIALFKGATNTSGQGACGYVEWDEAGS